MAFLISMRGGKRPMAKFVTETPFLSVNISSTRSFRPDDSCCLPHPLGVSGGAPDFENRSKMDWKRSVFPASLGRPSTFYRRMHPSSTPLPVGFFSFRVTVPRLCARPDLIQIGLGFFLPGFNCSRQPGVKVVHSKLFLRRALASNRFRNRPARPMTTPVWTSNLT